MDRKSSHCRTCVTSSVSTCGISVGDLPWVAGYLEGEGSFVRHNNRLRIAAVSTDSDVLQNLAKLCRTGRTHSITSRSVTHKPASVWAVQRRMDAQLIGMQLAPYLHARRREQLLNFGIELPDQLPLANLPTEQQVAWLAGWLEGEGSFSLQRRGSKVLTGSTTDADVAHSVLAVAGAGSLSYQEARRVTWKPVYVWKVCESEAIAQILKPVLPFLGERRTIQATTLLDAALKTIAKRRFTVVAGAET